jgi:hypothetical protein
MRALLALCAAAVLIAGCGRNDGDEAAPAPADTTTTMPPATTEPSPTPGATEDTTAPGATGSETMPPADSPPPSPAP